MPDIRNLEDLAEYAHQQVARIQRMQDDLADQYGTAESPRGYVRARTGPGGGLQELRIDPGAMRLSAEDVAAEVTAAITAAQREYADRANEIIAPVLASRAERGVAGRPGRGHAPAGRVGRRPGPDRPAARPGRLSCAGGHVGQTVPILRLRGSDLVRT